MIPKIIHQIWIGPDPIPEQEQDFIESWKKLHPSWENMMWTNENIHTLDIPPNCLEALEKAPRIWSCQSNILRYMTTLRHGGVYVDSDIECYKPIDELITDQLEFLGLKPHGGNWITSAFYGATKNHPLMKSLVKGIVPPKKKIAQGKSAWGPRYINKMYLKYVSAPKGARVEELQSSKEKILLPSFWTPPPFDNRDRALRGWFRGRSPVDPYCKHYYRASWHKK